MGICRYVAYPNQRSSRRWVCVRPEKRFDTSAGGAILLWLMTENDLKIESGK